MRKHRHSNSHGPYPSLSRQEDTSRTSNIPVAPRFSRRLLSVISSGDVEVLRQQGFLRAFVVDQKFRGL